MSKQTWLLAALAALGLASTQACSDDTPSPPASAGSGGHSAGSAGHSGSAGHAGTGLVSGGDTNGNAGQAGEPTSEAGAAGSAGYSEEAGSAGTSTGGSGDTGGTGGTGGTLPSGGTAGAGGSSTTFTLQTTTLGEVVATASGMTLYVFNTDTPGTSTAAPVSSCTSTQCLGNWPIYLGTPVSVPAGLQASDFSSFDRGSGVMQSAYKGWPLYSYAGDSAVGNVIGEGIGNKWYSVKLPFTTPGATTFTLQTTTLGSVIATADGLSLYVFKSDTVGTSTTPPVSACTGGCLSAWPIYHAAQISVPKDLLASDFGSYDRGSGTLQSTYKGWPLYRYTPDTTVGDVKGETPSNVNWYAAKSPFVLP
ncbi:MAG TPA: hypothetical protein VFK05_23235 [Polyangiaceae bacterium]|nr:hypothetical protein [Polyangiaceae bacterium]